MSRSTLLGFPAVVLTALLLTIGAAHAGAQDQAVLKICHLIDGAETSSQFSLRDLTDLGETGFTTSTIWTDGEVVFEGVALARLLEAEGITSGTLELIAINDYMIEIPVEEAQDSAALIAYRMDGQAMSTRDKGPLWLVYPFDADPRYQSETYYSRSIWQIDRIKVLPE
ncbi:oxidoreductase [Roseovarius faecimaris]|uniref:Oxidoreductase n=1 Tax=Roseovarius faecimaris TaxID=2494550 RepID=A0A6I6IKG0_9RHOB|nr:molybdopterin-dependent oxidoreductase [Roseovarius faecimaris]QGX97105.1 oxidoreductase [Roseovarius faecimaris]